MNDNEYLASEEEVLRVAIEGHLASTWSTMPAIVNSVNFAANTITAQVAIRPKVTDENGDVTDVNIPLLVDVPICFTRGGGFSVTVPIAVGDNVLISFADRCIDAWWQNGGVQNQEVMRVHDLSDGFAVLCPSSQDKLLSNVSATSLQVRSDDGGTVIDLKKGLVTITATSVKINGNLEVTGTTKMTGAITASSSLTANGAFSSPTATIGGIAFATHKHSNPEGGLTGGAQ
jgi:hypothetical protein